LMFYRDYYYSRTGFVHPVSDAVKNIYNKLERKVANIIHRAL
jgi:hypothetical protein